MQFEIALYLILVGTWPRSLFKQREEQSEHTFIREAMQVFLMCMHNTLSKLSQQTFSLHRFTQPKYKVEDKPPTEMPAKHVTC